MLDSYCLAADVVPLLGGYDLSVVGDAAAVAARVAQLLPVTRQRLEDLAGRDFFWHAGETVVLDGTGRGRLSLYETGCTPVAAVQAVVVDGHTLPPAAYAVYPQKGEIHLHAHGEGAGWRLEGRFPHGLQNVTVTLDWGYPQVPPEVSLAQAKLTAAELLAEAAGEKLTAAEVHLGDFSVRYAGAGKYAAAIQALVQEAGALVQGYRRVGMRVV
jgi:hypothetical protein